jgi:hypothetical protein
LTFKYTYVTIFATMKKWVAFPFIMLLLGINVQAQDIQTEDTTPKIWSKNGTTSLLFSQASFTNWNGGGENSLTIVGTFRYNILRKQGNKQWSTYFDTALGTQHIESITGFRKTEDRFEFNTKYGIEASENLYISVLGTMKSQYLPGYKYSDDEETLVSNLFAPGYIYIAFGFDYKPYKNFSLFVAPISTRYTLVLDQQLADQGEFGVRPAVIDPITGEILIHGSRTFSQVGLGLTCTYNGTIANNVNLYTNLDLFTPFKLLNEVVVGWDVRLDFRINKYLTTAISTGLIYDPNVISTNQKIINGEEVDVSKARVQFKEFVSMGIKYEF